MKMRAIKCILPRAPNDVPIDLTYVDPLKAINDLKLKLAKATDREEIAELEARLVFLIFRYRQAQTSV